jgi:hypothetical protein
MLPDVLWLVHLVQASVGALENSGTSSQKNDTFQGSATALVTVFTRSISLIHLAQHAEKASVNLKLTVLLTKWEILMTALTSDP